MNYSLRDSGPHLEMAVSRDGASNAGSLEISAIHAEALGKEDMIRVFINNWWLLALRGVFALLFAILVFSLRPLAESFFTRPIVHAGLVVVFALLALAAGISTIAASIYRAGKDRSHLLLWDGIALALPGS